MNPYIEYLISGLNGIRVNNGQCFSVENDQWIESVEIILSNDRISGIKVIYKHDIILDDAIKELTEKKVRQFITNIICNLDVDVEKFDYHIVQIHNPNEPEEKANKLQMRSKMSFACSLTFVSGHDISKFAKMFGVDNKCNNQDKEITLLLTIMEIDNIVVRYLMQYEFLMKMVSQNKPKQKEVTKFIKIKYNPTLGFNTIRLIKKVRINQDGKARKYKEDEITYYRNVLAHNNFERIDMKELEEKINMFSKAMNKVIYFAMNERT